MTARRVVLLAAALAVSCGPQTAPSPSASATLGGDVVARVRGDAISATLVAEVARAQSVPPRDALAALVDDAVAAAGARERSLDQALPASWRMTAARARFTAEAIRREARAQGAPTDEELAAATLRHWQFVDRGVTVRVVHALATRTPKSSATPDALRQTAERLREAVVTAKDEADFHARAKAVTPPPGVRVVVESLAPFTDDGWAAEGTGRMEEHFTKASWNLATPGATSPAIETPFGFHVIRLVERIPPRRMPLAERRVALAEEIYAERAKAMAARRRAAALSATKIEVSPAAETLTSRLFAAGAPP